MKTRREYDHDENILSGAGNGCVGFVVVFIVLIIYVIFS